MSAERKPGAGGEDHTEALRARALETDQRVAEVMHLMSNGEWDPGPSHHALMAKYGVAWETVRNWAVQAGRTLRILENENRDALRARNRARLDEVYEMALERQEVVRRKNADDEVVDAPDLKAAVAAVAEQGKLLGLNAPERKEIAMVVARYEQMPPAQRAEWLRAKAQELLDEATRLEQGGSEASE